MNPGLKAFHLNSRFALPVRGKHFTERKGVILHEPKEATGEFTHLAEFSPLEGLDPQPQFAQALNDLKFSAKLLKIYQHSGMFFPNIQDWVDLQKPEDMDFAKNPKLIGLRDKAPVKVKVSKEFLKQHKAGFKTFLNETKISGHLVRLDLNQSLDLGEAIFLFKDLPQDSFDYIEEPILVMDIAADWKKFFESTGIHVAMDESISKAGTFDWLSLGEHRELSTLVLKPGLLGLERTEKIAKWADLRGLRVVLSSTFDSPVGTFLQYLLVSFLGLKNEFHGLAPTTFVETNFSQFFDKNSPKEGLVKLQEWVQKLQKIETM